MTSQSPHPAGAGAEKEGFREPEAKEKNFFAWIRRKPLKSPESAKGIQGNPSLFSWNCLDFLGFIWRSSLSP
jgi:hypothetical protein